MFHQLRARSKALFRERVTPVGVGRSVLLVCLGALVAGALLVWLAPFRGPVHSVQPAIGSVALRTAGADRPFVIAYLGIGFVRLYLTGISLVPLLAGIAAGLTGRWWGVPAAVLLGMATAGTVTVLGGCNCGSGSTAFLAQQAAQALADGTAPIVAGRA